MTITANITETTINASVNEAEVAVSVTSIPINITISGTGGHDSVTIGVPANGLSITVAQVLSIGLASAIATGALSSTDWSTFNNKQAALGYTPVNIASVEWIDLTDGGATSLHSHAGGGGTWGSITGTLSDQTDLQTALNAKQNSLGFTPVDSASANYIDLTDGGATTLHSHAGGSGDISGTGVVGRVAEFVTDTKTLQAAKLIGPASNILTITNAAASTLALNITSAKTLTLTAANDYTLTVPASLTVAGLAIANVYTAAQQITVATTSAVGLKLKTSDNNTTNKLFQILDSSNNELAAISAVGEAGFGGYGGDSSAALMVQKTASAASQRGGQMLMISGASNRVGIGGAVGILRLNTAITHTGTGGNAMFALGGQLQISGSAATTAEVQVVRSMASISIGTLTLLNHFVINDIVITGSGVVTAQNGIYIYDLVNAATNYAIYTNAGLVRFGDVVNTTASYQVDGTQVVTNRVIDARIDDVINSGDATTDGVIDAIRDALITHGLIAAA